MASSTSHSSTRRRAGHPPRQRHAQSRAHHEKTRAEDIAQSLKRSSLASRRRRGTPFQSAMSMLNFYINRAGKNLPKSRRNVLQSAKGKLREAFGRPR